MPIKTGRLLYAGVEIKIVRGEANKSLGLDDVARCLGFEAADEVVGFLDRLEIGDEKYPVRSGLERGYLYMISVAGAIKLAEAFDSDAARDFAIFLRKELNHWERLRYNDLADVKHVVLKAPERISRQTGDDQSGLPPLA